MNKLVIQILLVLCFIISTNRSVLSQSYSDQNGIKTSVIKNIAANGTQAKRYEIAQVCMNSHHWQYSGFMIIELFNSRPYTSYEKYKVQLGYLQGTGTTSPKVKLVESDGYRHDAKLVLGAASLAGTSYGGYENIIVPIYVDVAYYSNYTVKITYLYNKVDAITGKDQIKIYDSPASVDLANFIAPTLNFTDTDFSMRNGTVAADLNVAGTIKATEIKVEAQTADFVFEEDYQLKSLEEVEQFITNNKHLPDVPSAKQMEENGVGLAEMNKLLLQKVEELTLYVIEQQKEIEQLKAKEEKITDLEKAIELLNQKPNE